VTVADGVVSIDGCIVFSLKQGFIRNKLMMTNLPCNMVLFVSYNSRGLNVSIQSYLRNVLADCHNLLLQERSS